MMQRIKLDFSAARRGSPWLGRVMLAVAAAVCLDAGMTYADLRKMLDANEARVARRTPSGAVAKVSAQEVAAVRETVQRLSLPWDELFAALESAASDKVVLAAIEPDTGKGTVTISGDGKNYLATLSYVSNLSRSEGLDRVQLVRHEQKANDPNGPVSFAVSAAWSTK
ncbi:MAG TPA: PilN domain-containing protein [Burkholderiales bacterium]|nr:PilN domain-containing protein [Burkholderiales bacterium]